MGVLLNGTRVGEPAFGVNKNGPRHIGMHCITVLKCGRLLLTRSWTYG